MRKLVMILVVLFYVVPSFSQTMEWHIKADYNKIEYLGYNLFKVNKDGKWGVVNGNGNICCDIKYDSIAPFAEDRALLMDSNGLLLRIINERGETVKDFSEGEFVANYPYFKEGMLPFGHPGKGYGYLDINGKEIIAPKYLWAAPFCDGMAVVRHNNKKKTFSIINKGGANVFVDNRTILFVSTPVDSVSFLVVQGRKAHKIMLAKIINGRLSEIEKLADFAQVKIPNPYSVSCSISGEQYYFDEAMRLIRSSAKREFNNPLINEGIMVFSEGDWERNGANDWNILNSTFKKIVFCGGKYAVVTTQGGTKGVLELNPTGDFSITDIHSGARFRHNAKVKGDIAIKIDGLKSGSRAQIGITGLNGNAQEELFDVPNDRCDGGIYLQPIEYFIPSNRINTEVSCSVKINLYIDKVLHKSEDAELTGVHETAFSVTMESPEYTDPYGKATIELKVNSLPRNSIPSPNTVITINNGRGYKFNEKKVFKYEVEVPEGAPKEFTYTIRIEEPGCPVYKVTKSKIIKHYYDTEQ